MSVSKKDQESFISAYIECALWSSTGEDDTPLDSLYSVDDFAPETIDRIRKDCDWFMLDNSDSIESGEFKDNYSRAGHDFWLNRNGHGAGFWDGGWPSRAGHNLDQAARAFPEIDLYSGDDGKLYIFG